MLPGGAVAFDETFGTNAISNESHGTSDIGNPANGIAVDPTGNAYVVGTTDSNTFGASVPGDPTDIGGYNTYVLKINPQGGQSYPGPARINR